MKWTFQQPKLTSQISIHNKFKKKIRNKKNSRKYDFNNIISLSTIKLTIFNDIILKFTDRSITMSFLQH